MVKQRRKIHTSLFLVLRAEAEDEPAMPLHGGKPGVQDGLLVRAGRNPNRMRKHKSGELPRRGPR